MAAVPDPAAADDAEERDEFESNTWQAFRRVALDNATPAEAGAELGMTASAVRMAKCRVLRRLREELGDLMQ